MSEEKNMSIQLDDFLADQEVQLSLFVLEPVSSDDSKVKVTPWSEGVECSCGSSVILDKDIIDGVKPTGQVHNCCGKQLKVVEVEFKKDASIRIEDLVSQIRTRNKSINYPSARPYRGMDNDIAPYDDISYPSDSSNYQEMDELQKSVQHSCPPNTFHKVCGRRHLCVYDGHGSCCGERWCPRGTSCRFRHNRWVCIYD